MQNAADRLRAAGLRVTRPRLAVLAEVAAHPHADVETITAGARAQLGSLSTQAVYNVVHALNDAGLLRCIESAGPPARFELATSAYHHHFVCRACRQIADAACSSDAAACLRASDAADYLIDETEVTHWGLCASCQATAKAAAAPTTTPTIESNAVPTH